ncbi:hypothetical protein HCA58_20640 [Micromonospora sp. HNM0581]|uniref:RICIN domain-containing protein n=1 Tax=Micromonospora sp. HNM0581 TaxID=2716341 RepID=UPI001469B958|nr:hypothetical protein [Micromonospora sp. HNM0581]NLU80728.1 hypothetical protein [Micromonospora sp. HNM0581]
MAKGERHMFVLKRLRRRRSGQPSRWLAGFLVVTTVLAGAVLGATAPATAGYVGHNMLRNWASGRCLDSNAAGDVYSLPCQFGNRYQLWEPRLVARSGYDVVTLWNVQTGRCLHQGKWWPNLQRGSLLTSSNVGDCNFMGRWEAQGSSWTVVRFQEYYYDTCIGSNNSRDVYYIGCNSTGYQKWRLGY